MVRVTSALFPMDSTLCIIKPDAMRLGYKHNICHTIHMFGFNVVAEATFKVNIYDLSLFTICSLRTGFQFPLTRCLNLDQVFVNIHCKFVHVLLLSSKTVAWIHQVSSQRLEMVSKCGTTEELRSDVSYSVCILRT